MRALPAELVEGIVAAIKAGKTVQIIHRETGISESTIRYQAFKNGLLITSRYVRVQPAMYWNSKLGRYWRTQRLNTQMGVSLIGKHGSKAPCSTQDQACDEPTRSPSCLVAPSGG